MKFAVTVISPPGYIHSSAFFEIAESLHYGLLLLGHDSVLTSEGQLPGRQHIVLGANLLPHYVLPLAPDAILYNLEQIQCGSSWISPALIEIYRRHTLWDYSPTNANALASLGVGVARILPIGYASELTRIGRPNEPDIDVLFIGSMCPRRQHVIDLMRSRGLKVEAVFGIYGQQRDALVSRARLLINIHYYEAKVLEMVRISYLLANHCAVLSERSSDAAEDDALAQAIAFCDYDELPRRAQELIESPDELARLSRCGFELMRSRPVAEYLRAALS
ncbi:hypothetical protein AYM40_19830 [Paraburkholderia phytofirmans OLGA172]|uniref:Glycosyltransferase n=1 Tax=Paraburkholderia phytofirmans OLGA172 TaxID=1417228 RepID=A0A160FP12_9BURK|nr:hypothetical protein [Paraburkholderia phytofirmans]ANB74371.1 hypothetical protein AYM40_19830 [Paraburkholderia phytofirmans OLGA172]